MQKVTEKVKISKPCSIITSPAWRCIANIASNMSLKWTKIQHVCMYVCIKYQTQTQQQLRNRASADWPNQGKEVAWGHCPHWDSCIR